MTSPRNHAAEPAEIIEQKKHFCLQQSGSFNDSERLISPEISEVMQDKGMKTDWGDVFPHR